MLQRVAGDADGVEEMLREADLDADGQWLGRGAENLVSFLCFIGFSRRLKAFKGVSYVFFFFFQWSSNVF